MPTVRQIRLLWKPAVFAAALLPLLGLAAGVALEANPDLAPNMPGVKGLELGANPVETIQDTTGIWALRFLLITLALTPLRWFTGQAWLVQFRRMLGLFAFTYALLHFSNYLLLDRALDFSEIVPDIAKRPYITLGFTALLLLVPLAVTSTAGWRRRLGARWEKLHRLIYVIAILACWHFWWQVKEDITEPLVYCLILAALFGVRLWRARRRATGSSSVGGASAPGSERG
jgi:sulfoxide reductase heme-binding subunit YedZ